MDSAKSQINMDKKKIIRVSTVPQSLNSFCRGMLKELSTKYDVIALSSPGKEMREIAEREVVRTIEVPMERHISLTKDLKSLFSVIKVFRKEKPDMVHSMTPKAGLLCMIAGWITRVPVRVHTFTGLVFPTETGMKRNILMLTDKLTCACATHIIPEGEGVKDDLLSYKITKKPLKVLGYGNVRGVDMNFYSRRSEVVRIVDEQNLRDKSKFTFLFVGRIVRDKGINELVSAFNSLQQNYKNLRLFLVGRFEDNLDPISDSCRNIIHNHSSIMYVGSKTGNELLAYYFASDCFVLPSYREGFPNTVLEAGAMGLPSIVTDINGSREIIKNGKNGLIIPSKNVEALYNAMEHIILDKDATTLMASNARPMIGARFEQSFVRKCLYDFYDEVLN